ncbi:MAG: porin [Alphaproteobacteria bacterium]
MSKKLLLGSTALVGAFALATPALADIEVTLSGQVEFGLSAADSETIDDGRGYFFFMDSETKLQAEGAADNGINYSAKVELETDADIQNRNADETVLAFWGGFGRVELGREDGAQDSMYVAGEDFAAGTGGIDGDLANTQLAVVDGSSDAAKVTYYSPRIAGFQLGASFTPDTGDAESDSDDDAGDFENHWGVGANFTTAAGGADITLSAVGSFGDAEVGGDDLEDWSVGGGVEFAGLGIGAGYVDYGDSSGKGNGYTAGAKYGFGPANVSVNYSYDDRDSFDDAVGFLVFSADYGLFPGVTLKGDVGFNDNDQDAGGDSTTAGVVTLQLDY